MWVPSFEEDVFLRILKFMSSYTVKSFLIARKKDLRNQVYTSNSYCECPELAKKKKKALIVAYPNVYTSTFLLSIKMLKCILDLLLRWLISNVLLWTTSKLLHNL